MPKLPEPVKAFIVQRLACFDTPTQVAAAVKEEFGLEVTRQRVHEYDPGRKSPGKKWRALFDSTRARFLEGVSDIPSANKATRIRRLERMAVAAEASKNYALAAQLYEQIAKEMGGLYTNKRELAATLSVDDLLDAADGGAETGGNGGAGE